MSDWRLPEICEECDRRHSDRWSCKKASTMGWVGILAFIAAGFGFFFVMLTYYDGWQAKIYEKGQLLKLFIVLLFPAGAALTTYCSALPHTVKTTLYYCFGVLAFLLIGVLRF